MHLMIDTSKPGQVKVVLDDRGKVIELCKANEFGSQILLPLIKEALEKVSKDFDDIKKISMATGPGSFTGIRVGASVANALAYALSIPINGKKQELDFKIS